ncbi:MAG: Ku protein [Alphaproteobacteria bacterium]|nr:Ku protein [Alphaproteobacteria bacterium]
MARRPVWQGHLRLSLVACPVALYPATSTASDVHFHLLHKETHQRIHMVPHDPERGEVSRKDLVRGFEVEKGKYVIVSDAELTAVKLESTRLIDIDRFVKLEDIDRIYWNTPYDVTPNGKAGLDAYLVIRDAMRAAGRVGLGRLVLHSHERMVALEPRDKGFLLTTLLTHDEVRDDRELFRDIPASRADKRMTEIAQKIIEQMEGEFDPRQFHDRYEDALRQLIAEKRKGHKPVAALPPEDGAPTANLMDALRKSLAGADAGRTRARRSVRARGARHARQAPRRRTAHAARRHARG